MRKKITISLLSIVLLIGAFAGGAYAATTWLTFDGDEQISESESHVDEIMQILRDINEEKITAEEALAELEEMNPPGLVKQIKALEEEIKGLQDMNEHQADYISHLESELERANQKVGGLNNKTTDALNEARQIGGQ